MKDIKTLVQELNAKKIKQTCDLDECLDINLDEETNLNYFQKLVEEGLYVDKHRWYETSVSVFKVNDGYLGVTAVTDIFSEQMDVSDAFHYL